MLLETDPDLVVEGSLPNTLTPVYAVVVQTLEAAGIDPHTADDLAQIVTTRVEARWQAIGLVVRHVE